MLFSGDTEDRRSVQNTRELARIANLPRRVWTDEAAEQFAAELTIKLRLPGGTMSLRPIQAVALFEAFLYGGLVGPIGVGEGKTLLSVLLAYVMKSRRPMLVTRANLKDKTLRDMRELAQHWPVPNFIRLESYEKLGRAGHSDALKNYMPDLLICDEAHKIRNPKAAVTKRIARYMSEVAPTTRFVGISGTITRRSLRDYAHLITWALKPMNAPVPHGYSEIDDWANALDERPNGEAPLLAPGALLTLCTPAERIDLSPVKAARAGFGRRLTETPGIVASSGKEFGVSLTIQALEIDVSPALDEAFQVLRAWKTPDGCPIPDPMTLWRHARELGLGFYYRWDPRPPDEWLEARKAWYGQCRHILTHNRRDLDSALQVANAVDRGLYPEATATLQAWRLIEPSFKPNPVPVWIDDSALKACAVWGLREKGIIWTEHTSFALELSKQSGITYYGRGGVNTKGKPIEDHDPNESLIASIPSSGEGRNLQNWNRALVTACSASWSPGIQWEQLLGREHRPGQMADDVTYDVLVTCREHLTGFEQAQRDALYQQDKLRIPQRIVYADKVFPTSDEVITRPGARWIKNE